MEGTEYFATKMNCAIAGKDLETPVAFNVNIHNALNSTNNSG